MRLFSILSILALCSCKSFLGSGVPGDSAEETRPSTRPSKIVTTDKCVYTNPADNIQCLRISGAVLPRSDDCAAIVGTYHGPSRDLKLSGYAHEVKLGWVYENDGSVGYANARLQEDDQVLFEYFFRYKLQKSGVYRLKLRAVRDCLDPGLNWLNGLQEVGWDKLVEPENLYAWGNIEPYEGDGWIWCGIDERGLYDCSIVVEYHESDDWYYPAAQLLPANLNYLSP